MMKKVLLTTIHKPLGVENNTSTENIQADQFNVQLTRAQGVFNMRSLITGWSLDFIAANLESPTTVLHYPTKKKFIKVLKKGYDFVGISIVNCTYPKAIELSELTRRVSPSTKIVFGGYGTLIQECEKHADYVCREEGVNYMKRLLGEKEVEKFKIPIITKTQELLNISKKTVAVIPVGLGCSRGCEFCSTSYFFKRQVISLVKTGKELHTLMKSVDPGKQAARNIGICDEDFLANRVRIEELISLNSTILDKPILFSCMSSMHSITQYDIHELLCMGLSGVWIGTESKNAEYPKLKGIDAVRLFNDLKKNGINTVTSMIIGYDWHDKKTLEDDFEFLLSLRPIMTQFLLYSPTHQTPLHNRLKKEGRLLENIPYKYHDGFHALLRHPHFSAQELEELVDTLFRREYEELGPSICRILEVQWLGYQTLKPVDHPLYQARAEVHKKMCIEIYPILNLAIKKAPTDKVRVYLKELKEKIENEFEITALTKAKQIAVPLAALYSQLRTLFYPNPQPPTITKHFRFS